MSIRISQHVHSRRRPRLREPSVRSSYRYSQLFDDRKRSDYTAEYKNEKRLMLLRTLGFRRTSSELLVEPLPEIKEEEEEPPKYNLYYDGEHMAPIEVSPFEELFEHQVDFRYKPFDELDLVIDPGWYPFLRYDKPWAEDLHPVKRLLTYSELKVEDKDLSGGLSGLIMATGLTNLSKVPNTVSYALTKLQLPNKSISDISLISRYKYLQYIDISHNDVEDLAALQYVPHLMVLDVSFNKICRFEINPPPWFLTYVNLSYNQIADVPDFTPYWSIKHLNLSNNQLTRINEGLRKMRYLRYLNLSNNKLILVENLFGIPLVELDLSHNRIVGEIQDVTHTEDFQYFRSLLTLEDLNLNSNRLKRLNFISTARLRKLVVSNNLLSSIQAIDDIGRMSELKELVIHGNEVMEIPDIYRHLTFVCPKIEKINKETIGSKERMNAQCMYGENMISEAIKNHGYSLIYNHIEPPPLGEELIDLNGNAGVVVLVGPPGSGIETIIANITRKHGAFVRALKLHVASTADSERPREESIYKSFPEMKKSVFNPRLDKSDFVRKPSRRRTLGSVFFPIKKHRGTFKVDKESVGSDKGSDLDSEDEATPEEPQTTSLCHQVTNTQFNVMWKNGKFLFVFHHLGNSYGLTFDELIDDGKVCLVGVSLQQAYELKWHGLESTFVLTMPSTESIHRHRVEEYFHKVVPPHNKTLSKMWSMSQCTKKDVHLAPRPKATFQFVKSEEVYHENLPESFDALIDGVPRYSALNDAAFSFKSIPWLDDEPTFEVNVPIIGAKEIDAVLKKDVATERSLSDSVERVISTRDQYVRAHEDCFFLMAVSSDDLSTAERKITKIVNNIYNTKAMRNEDILQSVTPKPKHRLYNNLVKPALDEMIDILKDNEKLEWMDVKSATPAELGLEASLSESMSSLTFASSRESVVMDHVLVRNSVHDASDELGRDAKKDESISVPKRKTLVSRKRSSGPATRASIISRKLGDSQQFL